jgi:2-polyprenyl-3-methyl-5-hydroxy-6-metoxy-1,4-benzoquinol methylase
MAILGGTIGYRVLQTLFPPQKYFFQKDRRYSEEVKHQRLSLEQFFGPEVWEAVAGNVVIDFGCGSGRDSLEIAQHGAKRVIGIDIRQNVLDLAAAAAQSASFADRCVFCRETDEMADVVFSINAFEHYADPAGILRKMALLLKPTGRIWICFGPPWLHPRGGHGLAVFPWAHVIFSEQALMRWRSGYRTDQASRFKERADGLNQMTVARFVQLVESSPLRFEQFETIPIRKLRALYCRLTREFFTSFVRCRLALR